MSRWIYTLVWLGICLIPVISSCVRSHSEEPKACVSQKQEGGKCRCDKEASEVDRHCLGQRGAVDFGSKWDSLPDFVLRQDGADKNPPIGRPSSEVDLS